MAYTDSTGSFAKKFCSKSPFKTGERTFPENLPPKTGTVQGALTGLVSKGLNKVKKKMQNYQKTVSFR